MRRRLLWPAAVVALLGGLVAGPGPAPAQDAQPEVAATGTADARQGADGSWTYLVYMVADNNLEPAALYDLEEMLEVGSTDDVNLLVLVDRLEVDWSQIGQRDGPIGNLDDFTTAKLLRVEKGSFQQLGDFDEINMGRADVLSWFIEQSVQLYPAQNYGLALWDHGAAWQGGFVDEGGAYGGPDPTAQPDYSKFDRMALAEISEGIAGGLRASGLDRFDLLGFDACLMANFETASVLAPTARYLLASEELEPGHGWDYRGLAPMLDGASAEDVGRSMLAAYQAQANEMSESESKLITLALLDLDRIGALESASQAFSRAATSQMDEVLLPISQARAKSLEFVKGFQASDYNLIDLGDFLRHLDAEALPADVATARGAMWTALENTVVAQVTGANASQATGLSVYLPLDPAQYLGTEYESINEKGGWRDLVLAVLTAGNEQPADTEPVQFVDGEATIEEISPAGVIVQGQLRPGSGARVVNPEIYTGVTEDDAFTIWLAMPAVVGAGGADTVQGIWSWAAVALTDGTTSTIGTTQFQAQAEGFRGAMLTEYTDASGTASSVRVDIQLDYTGQVAGVSFFQQVGSDWAAFEPAEGDSMVPQLVTEIGGELVLRDAAGPAIVVGDDLGAEIVRVSPGSPFTAALVVRDANRNSSVARVSGTVQ